MEDIKNSSKFTQSSLPHLITKVSERSRMSGDCILGSIYYLTKKKKNCNFRQEKELLRRVKGTFAYGLWRGTEVVGFGRCLYPSCQVDNSQILPFVILCISRNTLQLHSLKSCEKTKLVSKFHVQGKIHNTVLFYLEGSFSQINPPKANILGQSFGILQSVTGWNLRPTHTFTQNKSLEHIKHSLQSFQVRNFHVHSEHRLCNR